MPARRRGGTGEYYPSEGESFPFSENNRNYSSDGGSVFGKVMGALCVLFCIGTIVMSILYGVEAGNGESATEQTGVADWVVENNNVIYQVNVWRYPAPTGSSASDGTFEAISADAQRLKDDLGVSVLQLMPIHPVGNSQLSKSSVNGSHYSVAAWDTVNPALTTNTKGAISGFKDFIKAVHKNQGMKVVMEVVLSATSFEHPFVQTHPDYYIQNTAGEIVNFRADTDGAQDFDLAQLNCSNPEVGKAVIAYLQQYHNYGVDGFAVYDGRSCFSLGFWKRLKSALGSAFLYEGPGTYSNRPNAPGEATFQGGYASEFAAWLKTASTTETAAGFVSQLGTEILTSPLAYAHIRPTSDADAYNLLAATTKEESFYGDNYHAALALLYTMPGIPLITQSTESDASNHGLYSTTANAFDETLDTYILLKGLATLRKEHVALHGTGLRSDYVTVPLDAYLQPDQYAELNASLPDGVFGFVRVFENDRVLCLFNFEATNQTVYITSPEGPGSLGRETGLHEELLPPGNYTNVFCPDTIDCNNATHEAVMEVRKEAAPYPSDSRHVASTTIMANHFKIFNLTKPALSVRPLRDIDDVSNRWEYVAVRSGDLTPWQTLDAEGGLTAASLDGQDSAINDLVLLNYTTFIFPIDAGYIPSGGVDLEDYAFEGKIYLETNVNNVFTFATEALAADVDYTVASNGDTLTSKSTEAWVYTIGCTSILTCTDNEFPTPELSFMGLQYDLVASNRPFQYTKAGVQHQGVMHFVQLKTTPSPTPSPTPAPTPGV